ncbi:hypothetical protein GJ496_003030 [Pomphorhynchus laevis]|nr:hypothetical protein GJ496_003030 [Pomphorhynchus laevis]
MRGRPRKYSCLLDSASMRSLPKDLHTFRQKSDLIERLVCFTEKFKLSFLRNVNNAPNSTRSLSSIDSIAPSTTLSEPLHNSPSSITKLTTDPSNFKKLLIKCSTELCPILTCMYVPSDKYIHVCLYRLKRHIEHTIRSESNGVCYSPLSGFVPSNCGLSAPSPKSSIPTYEAVKNSTFGKDIPSNYVNHITSHSQQYQHKITNRSVARFVTYNKRRPKFASPRQCIMLSNMGESSSLNADERITWDI